ncbi:MAG: hypothetical protein EOO96_25150, partial [Pedobacter sp.]
SNLLILLRAFSLFKKRQKSAMQLMLLMNGININDCITDFRLYKYRDDVKIIGNVLDDAGFPDLVGSCMAMIYLPGADGTGITLAEALQCATADAARIYFDGKYFREDIGFDLI